MINCLFCDFATKKIKKDFVLETETVMVFPDIKPVAEVHLLVVPKRHIKEFSKLDLPRHCEERSDAAIFDVWTEIARTLQKLIKNYKLEGKGYRIVINGGGAQAINHLHVHLMGGVSL